MPALTGLACAAASLVTSFQTAILTHLDQQTRPVHCYAASAQASVPLLRKLKVFSSAFHRKMLKPLQLTQLSDFQAGYL